MMRLTGPSAWFLIALLIAISVIFLSNQSRALKEIDYTFFKQQLEAGNIEYVQFEGRAGTGKFKKGKEPDAPREVNSKGELETPMEDGERAKLKPRFRVTIPEWAPEEELQDLTQLLHANYEETPSTYSDPSERSAVVVTILSLLLPILLIVLPVFWIWMLIDCLRNEPSVGNDKLVWTLVIILLNVLGALIYFVVRRPDRARRHDR